MSSDDQVWALVTKQVGFDLAAGKKRLTHACRFCRKYCVAGRCTRTFCPLANARYATVLESSEGAPSSTALYAGPLYLCVKTAERANYPTRMWQRTRLSKSYSQGTQQGVSAAIVSRCKQRLTRLFQMQLRMRHFALKGRYETVVASRRTERRERSRLREAEVAAHMEAGIRGELVRRHATEAARELQRQQRGAQQQQQRQQQEGEREAEGAGGRQRGPWRREQRVRVVFVEEEREQEMETEHEGGQ
eukprot:m51a1_g10762 hypothetical protein (247) ;mRNA; f:12678-13674